MSTTRISEEKTNELRWRHPYGKSPNKPTFKVLEQKIIIMTRTYENGYWTFSAQELWREIDSV